MKITDPQRHCSGFFVLKVEIFDTSYDTSFFCPRVWGLDRTHSSFREDPSTTNSSLDVYSSFIHCSLPGSRSSRLCGGGRTRPGGPSPGTRRMFYTRLTPNDDVLWSRYTCRLLVSWSSCPLRHIRSAGVPDQ